MRCKNKVIVNAAGRVKEWRSKASAYVHLSKPKDAERVEKCGGEVRAEIETDSGGRCCSRGTVEINLRCQRCKCSDYPILLTLSDAEAALTAYISDMTDKEYGRLEAKFLK